MTHDMELDTPLALDQDRRSQTLEAAQNTAAEGPHRVYCGDTRGKEDKETIITLSESILEKGKQYTFAMWGIIII